MHWADLKSQWQARQDVLDAPVPDVSALMQADQAVHAAVWRRDWMETLGAGVVMLAFTGFTVRAWSNREWLEAAIYMGIALWSIYVAMRLRRARHQVPVPEASAPLREHLQQSRQAALIQAHMLERVWLWYVLPFTVASIVLVLAGKGPTVSALTYVVLVSAFGALVAWLNRRAARRYFRRHADALARLLAALEEPGGPATPDSPD